MKIKGQASIEFSIAFVCTILFLFLTCNIFVWLSHCLVRRQVAYSDSRRVATTRNDPGKDDFFDPPDLSVFRPGGRR
ncbi:MAG: hypothetical protein PVI33_01465 [Candidatus Omnitrophota bacterium]|jgi:hypothetical protein